MYMRSSISAQSLASVPPSRALIVTIAPARVVRAVEQRLELELVEQRFEPRDFAGHFGGERLVFVGHFDHGGEVVAAT